MAVRSNAGRIAELWRYYKIGIVNTAFGYGLYSLLIFSHLNMYIAQITSHFTGMIFNFFMFKWHVFRGVQPRIITYVAAYGLNYLLGLFCITVSHKFIKSPYIAGFCSLFFVSSFSYFVLKRFVFKAGNQPRVS